MAGEKELAEAELVLLPEGWEGDLDADRKSDLMFVVQLRDEEPVRLGRLERPRHRGEVTRSAEQGEPLVPARVELPDGSVLDLHFARQGAVWERDDHHLFLPAREAFEAPEDVAAMFATPNVAFLSVEQLPGRRGRLPPPRTETLECLGPPPHTITVAWGAHSCPEHPEAHTERV